MKQPKEIAVKVSADTRELDVLTEKLTEVKDLLIEINDLCCGIGNKCHVEKEE